jgi:hypothetical protein
MSEATLAAFERAGVDLDAVAVKLQTDAADALAAAWDDLMGYVAQKSGSLATVR